MRGIHYVSMFEASGYGVAGVSLLRALANAGVPVKWTPFAWDAGIGKPRKLDYRHAMNSPFMRDNSTQSAWRDLPHLARLIDAHVDHDVVIIHTVPEHWPSLSEPGRRNIGHTVWETTRLPLHWVPLFNAMDSIIVPCRFNQQVTRASGCKVPVHIVPHVRRVQWQDFRADTLAQLSTAWGLLPTKFTFYSINVWDIRKNLALLVRAFAHAFSASDPVQLLIKTSARGHLDTPPYPQAVTADIISGLLNSLDRDVGHDLPSMHFIVQDNLPSDQIDALHDIGDCFVSLSHGEGWGLGAFDAATFGNPVIIPSWGGVLDYLPQERTGAVPYVPSQVPIWPPYRPSYWSDQSWVDVSLDDAVTALRSAFSQQQSMREEALAIQATIADEFAEARVAQTLLQALGR